jgi:ribosome modulation factor
MLDKNSRQQIEQAQIRERGRRDKLAGVPQAQCPYRAGGDNVQQQRRTAWLEGWNAGLPPGTERLKLPQDQREPPQGI